MRLLDLADGVKGLDKLGMTEHSLSLFRRMIEKQHGMVLLTGPTGSGKTTTLYSALQHLNREETNIITVEDPVEYMLDGVNQMQVHPAAGLTFARGCVRSCGRTLILSWWEKYVTWKRRKLQFELR